MQAPDSVASYIVTVNSPLQTFAKRLVTESMKVKMPAAAQVAPSEWQSTIDDIQLLKRVQLVLLNGAGYSSWLNRVSLSDGAWWWLASPVRNSGSSCRVRGHP